MEGHTLPSSLDYFQTISQRWTLTFTFQSLPALYNTFLCPKLLVFILFKLLQPRQPPLKWPVLLFAWIILFLSSLLFIHVNWWSLIIPTTSTFQTSSLSFSNPSFLPSLNNFLTSQTRSSIDPWRSNHGRKFPKSITGEHRIEIQVEGSLHYASTLFLAQALGLRDGRRLPAQRSRACQLSPIFHAVFWQYLHLSLVIFSSAIQVCFAMPSLSHNHHRFTVSVPVYVCIYKLH